MKKLLAFPLLFFVFISSAQKSIAIKGGINFANLRDDQDNSSSGGIIGYHFGLSYNIKTPSIIVFKPELGISLQGGSVKVNNISNITSISYFYLSAILSTESQRKLYFDAGLQTGVRINAKRHTGDITKNVTDSIKPLDLSFVLGAGYKLTDRFHINVRYIYGMSDITKSKSDRSFHNNLQISLVYNIPLKEKKKKS